MMNTTLKRLALTLGFALVASACGGGEQTENNQDNNTTECTAGEVGCECKADSTCDGTAVCQSGTCVGATVSGLVVDASGARACEIMLEESGAKVLSIAQVEGAQAVMRRQAPRVAIAVAASGDADFPGSVGSLQVEGDLSGISVASVKCWNQDRSVIEGASASLK